MPYDLTHCRREAHDTWTMAQCLDNQKVWQGDLVSPIEETAETKRALKGDFSLINIGHDYYITRFSNLEDYEQVMTNGPWMIGDKYLVIVGSKFCLERGYHYTINSMDMNSKT